MPRNFINNPDHHNKPHIVLVQGASAKQSINYIYKGIQNINNESIMRAYKENGYDIIYFKNPQKNTNNFFNPKKTDVATNRACLKLILAAFIFRWERELNGAKENKSISNALATMHDLIHKNLSKDIKIEELKNPLQQILGEISTPPLKKVKIFTTQKSKKIMTQGLDRDALSRFNKMSQEEFKNAIRFIFPPIGGAYFKKEDDTANVESNQLIIKSMQSFITSYLELPLRTIATTQLAKLAAEAKNLDAIKIFCEKWAEARKGMKKNSNEGVSAIFGWRESMDTVVICLNRHLFRPVGASEIFSRVFKSDTVVDPHNLFASPTSPTNLYPQAELRSAASPLSPATLVAEDSTEKKPQGILRKVRFTTPSENIKQQLTFTDSPISPINLDRNYPTADSELDDSQDLDYVPSTLSPSIEEKVNSLLPDEAIFSPSVLPGRSLKRTHQNSAEVDGTNSIDRLLAELAISKPMASNASDATGNIQASNDIAEKLHQLLDDDLVDLLSDYNSMSKNYSRPEHTPEKPDSYRPQANQNKMQSALKKLSGNLTYQPMPTQQVSNSNPNPSITNAINNSTNNSINNRN
jgi:hypothetical protein